MKFDESTAEKKARIRLHAERGLVAFYFLVLI